MVQTFSSSLDTNLILRLALEDIPEQVETVKNLLCDQTQEFYVCDLVFAEIVFNLQTHSFSRKKIQEFCSFIFSLPNIHPESPFILDVLKYYESHPSLSFVDCYSAAFAEAKNHEPLLTFDQKLAKLHPSAKLVS